MLGVEEVVNRTNDRVHDLIPVFLQLGFIQSEGLGNLGVNVIPAEPEAKELVFVLFLQLGEDRKRCVGVDPGFGDRLSKISKDPLQALAVYFVGRIVHNTSLNYPFIIQLSGTYIC